MDLISESETLHLKYILLLIYFGTEEISQLIKAPFLLKGFNSETSDIKIPVRKIEIRNKI